MSALAHLIDDIKITIGITGTAGAAAATNVNGAVLDMSGWDGVLMVFQFGPIVATAVTSIKAQQDSAVGMGAAADLAGSGQAVAVADADKVFCIDLRRPAKQFVRGVCLRATANATVMCTYIQYRNRNKPTAAQGTNVAAERWLSPAEGAA